MGNEQVGVAYRSRDKVKPIFIASGHLCGIDVVVKIVISCLREYRPPEPLREAHRLVNWTKRRSMTTELV